MMMLRASRRVSRRGFSEGVAVKQHMRAGWTTWHFTFGTYGARLQGDGRLTVERGRNRRGEPFVTADARRAEEARGRMRGEVVLLTAAQRGVLEAVLPGVCERGGWVCRACAVPKEGDHVHVLLDAPAAAQGAAIRRWLKRWLGEELTRRWREPTAGTWWAKGGSCRAVKDATYLEKAHAYVQRQRTLPGGAGGSAGRNVE